MKQISITEVLEAFGDKPASIADRLGVLGADEKEISVFSKELLETQIYASSFIKFLQDNKARFATEILIPAKEIPSDWKDPFEEGEISVLARFVAIGFAKEELLPMFSEDVLSLRVGADEFQGLLRDNEKKLFERMNFLASQDT